MLDADKTDCQKQRVEQRPAKRFVMQQRLIILHSDKGCLPHSGVVGKAIVYTQTDRRQNRKDKYEQTRQHKTEDNPFIAI